MNISRTTSMVISSLEVKRAIKAFFPDIPILQTIDLHGTIVDVKANGSSGGLLVTFTHTNTVG